MPKCISIVLMALMMSIAGFGQSSGNAFLGYSFNHASTGFSNTGNLNGWEASVEGKVAPFTGLVADLGAQYGTLQLPLVHLFGGPGTVDSTTRVWSFLVGPRVSVSVGKFRPFAQALVGPGHLHEDAIEFAYGETCFVNTFGGGLDYRLTPLLAWRLQGDVMQTRFHGGTQNDVRISTGWC